MRTDTYGPLRYPKFWVAYFFVWTVFTIWPPLGSKTSVLSIAGWVINLMSLYPLYGYVWSRDFGFRGFWRIVVLIQLVLLGLSAIAIIAIAWHQASKGSLADTAKVFGSFVLILGITGPSFYAVWQYSRSPNPSVEA
jgi:hypothetical protein